MNSSNTIKCTIAVYEHKPGARLVVMEVGLPSEELWKYYHDSESSIDATVRGIAGIAPTEGACVAVYTDYLVNPLTGEALMGDESEDLDKFLKTVLERRARYLETREQ